MAKFVKIKDINRKEVIINIDNICFIKEKTSSEWFVSMLSGEVVTLDSYEKKKLVSYMVISV